MDWSDEPATEQQVSQLRKLGFVMAKPLSLLEAASLIRQYKKQAARRSTTPLPGVPAVEPPGAVSPMPPSGFRLERTWPMRVQRVTHGPASQADLGAAIPPPARAGLTGEAAARAHAERIEFWLDTFRENKEMKIGSVKAFELRQRHGVRFLAPQPEQVQDILRALDSAIPNWEHEHPEYFYQTLQLNFPVLARKPLPAP